MTINVSAIRRIIGPALILYLGLAWLAASQTQPPRQLPPEVEELSAARSIADPALRLKELLRIQAAYKDSKNLFNIGDMILDARVEAAETLDRILDLQQGYLDGLRIPPSPLSALMQSRYFFLAAQRIVDHPRFKSFDEASVKAALASYEQSAHQFVAQSFDSLVKNVFYKPAPFEDPAEWKGKVVLAELFTGSECGPCLAADLGFETLLEHFPSRYLAVLEYHLPIPLPDPMMNPATRDRQIYYGIVSTPTVFIDGIRTGRAGGARSLAGELFREYEAAITPLLDAEPGVKLAVRASLKAGKVEVSYDLDKAVPGAVYRVALVQREEDYRGSNGLQLHRHVVRAIVPVDPAAPKEISFDLATLEQATDAYLTEYERSYATARAVRLTRAGTETGFKWPARRAKIARTGLKVVFFAQDGTSKQVLNATIDDVK